MKWPTKGLKHWNLNKSLCMELEALGLQSNYWYTDVSAWFIWCHTVPWNNVDQGSKTANRRGQINLGKKLMSWFNVLQ